MTEEIERKRKEAAARQTATGKRKHGETPTPSWASRDMELEVGNQKPDDLILDTEERAIYIIEGARCSDTAESIQRREKVSFIRNAPRAPNNPKLSEAD